jgi:hypothetical protein
MSNKNKDIKQGFSGMNFGKKSKLFHEMPDYKPKATKKRTLNELRQTKDSVYKNPNKKVSHEKLRLEAEAFIDKEHYNLKADLNSAQFADMITALVDYKNNH